MVFKIKKIIILLMILCIIPVISATGTWLADSIDNGDLRDVVSIDYFDFNADGLGDFISASGGDGDSFEWFKNLGNDTYENFTIFDLNGANWVEGAYINSDEYADAVGCYDDGGSGGVLLFINDGDDTFTQSTIDGTYRCSGLHVGDIDSDGDYDIVSGDLIGDKVYLYINNGAGSFTDSLIASSIDEPRAFYMGDLDNDNDIDIIANSRSENLIYYLENDGYEGFTYFSLGSIDIPRILTIDDIDMDGFNDIIAGGNTEIAWFENDGDDTFTKHSVITGSSNCYGVESGDIDNDGDVDLIGACGGSTYDLLYLENQGNDTFRNHSIYNSATSTPRQVVLEDFNSDDSLDVAVAMPLDDEIRLFYNSFTFIDCDFPRIFCDDFNYLIPLAQKEYYAWNVVDEIGSVDLLFKPINYQLQLKSSDFKMPIHFNPTFDTNYRTSSSETVKNTDISPVFSTEFKIYPVKNNFTFVADDKTYATGVYYITGRNTSATAQTLYYRDSNFNLVTLCSDCIDYNKWNFIKITAFFVDYRGNHYNASFTDSEVQVYLRDGDGNTYFYEDIPFYDNMSVNQKWQWFEKEKTDKFYIDDYYVYVGTDKDVDTTGQYFQDLYVVEDLNVTLFDYEGSGDLAESIGSIWEDMGLKSLSSRIITGLFLMFILAIFYIGGSLSVKMHPSALVLGVLEIMFLILMTYIGLIPFWVLLIMIFITAGIGMLSFFMMSKSSA